jgi:hypothetical protein
MADDEWQEPPQLRILREETFHYGVDDVPVQQV